MEIAIIGLGVWGEKLTRVALSLGFAVHGFDPDSHRAHTVKRLFPNLILHNAVSDIFENRNIRAVIVAAPPQHHFALAKKALLSGKHVLVEKPMVTSLREAEQLRQLAEKTHHRIMIDYTFLFSPALRSCQRLISRGAIGTVTRIESIRTGSRTRPGNTVLWDLAPHDIAIAQFLLPQHIRSVRTFAEAYRPGYSLPQAIIELTTDNSVRYVGYISWDNPAKARNLSIIGSEGALAVSWSGKEEMLRRYQHGRVRHIQTPAREPLAEMLRHFSHTVKTGTRPTSDAKLGYANIRTISALTDSWKKNGARITL